MSKASNSFCLSRSGAWPSRSPDHARIRPHSLTTAGAVSITECGQIQTVCAALWWSADEDAPAGDGVDQAFGAQDFDGFLDGADGDAVPLSEGSLAGDGPPGAQFAGFDLGAKDGGQLLVDRHGSFMIEP